MLASSTMDTDTDQSSEEVIDIPCHFLCPISLQLMRDPVIVPTGITYDRDSIEKWLFFFNKATCPVTKQPLSACSDLTPNHTLRRLIQSWCTFNSYLAVERIIPTSKSAVVDVAYVQKLIDEAKSNPYLVASCVRRLRKACSVNKKNFECLEKAGGVEFLVSVTVSGRVTANSTKIGSKYITDDLLVNSALACLDEDALFLIQGMDLDAAAFKNIAIANNNVEFIHSLAHVMKCGTYSSQSRVYSILILRSLFQEADPTPIINVPTELFASIVRILSDNISPHATKNAMKLLVEICPWGRNKIKAVEAKAVSTVINFLHQSSEKRIIELSLTVLDQLCGCAEGRAELLNHEEGLAVVGRKLFRVSHAASNKAVRVLSSVSKHSANPVVLQEMLDVGVVEKMLLVLQSDCGVKMKERCREMLRVHARAWRTSPCIPPQLLAYYASSPN